jgi:uncharacterized repeat protein (TIGR01451 family)
MKKVCVFSLLLFAALSSGCGSLWGSGANDANTAPVVRSNRSYFFDQNLRPVAAVPSTSPSRSKAGAEVKPPAQSTPVTTPVTRPIGQPAAPETAPIASTVASDLRPAEEPKAEPRKTETRTPAASPRSNVNAVEDLAPVTPQRSTLGGGSASVYESQKIKGGSELVAITDGDSGLLKIIYPREDAGVIEIDKMMPKEVRVGTAFTYTIKVTNLTDGVLTDVTIGEIVSKEVQLTGSEPTASIEGNKLVWQIDSLGPRASKTFKVSGIPNAAKPLEHKTTITHALSGSAALNVVQPALKVIREAPAEAILCEPIPVDYTVTNTGTGTASNVQITDSLPAGLLTAEGRDRVVLDAGNLQAGESRRFSVKVRASKTGAFVCRASASSPAGLKGESEANTTTVRQPVLVITRSGPQRQYLGRPISYDIIVQNKGDGAARDTVLEEQVPSGVANIEATNSPQFMSSKLVWEIGTLQPTETRKVRVSYTPQQEGDVVSTATATAYCAETVTNATKMSVSGIASCRLEAVDLDDPIEVGTQTTYLVTVTNQGSAADANVRITCILDDKVQYVTSAGTTPGTMMGKTLTFTAVRSLEPKGKAQWRIVVKGLQSGDARFKVTMGSDKLTVPVEYTEVTRIYQP